MKVRRRTECPGKYLDLFLHISFHKPMSSYFPLCNVNSFEIMEHLLYPVILPWWFEADVAAGLASMSVTI
jgi:hypothetical protein